VALATQAPLWTGASAFSPLPGDARTSEQEAILRSVDCISASSCVAEGWYRVAEGEGGAEYPLIATTRTNGVWSAPELVAEQISTGSFFEPEGFSCAAAGACVIAGFYEELSQRLPVVLSEEGSWSQTTERLIAPPEASPFGEDGNLDAVSCAAGGSCTAVGWYENETSETLPMAATQTGGAWPQTAEPVELPEGGVDGELQSVSCSAAGSCVAVGYYESSEATQPMVAVQSGGVWLQAEAVLLPAAAVEGRLNGVSCANGGCTAVGSYANAEDATSPLIETQSGGAWTPLPLALPAGETGELTSVSCPVAGACSSAGSVAAAEVGPRQPIVTEELAGSWEPPALLANPGSEAEGAENRLDSISCPAADLCAAVGDYEVLNGEAPEETFPMTAGSAPTLEAGASAPAGQVGVPYTGQLTAAGGSGAYSWSVSSGALPVGLSLDTNTGVIAGTPTAAGTATLSATVSDPGPPSQTASEQLSITVNAAAVTPPPPKSEAIAKPEATPLLRILGSKLKLAGGKVKLKLACSNAACKGRLKLVAKVAVKVKGRGKGKAKVRRETLVLATGGYSLAAGGKKTFAIKLTAKGRELLSKKAAAGKLKLKLAATVKHGKNVQMTVKLTR
jgi:hypothetical protein